MQNQDPFMGQGGNPYLAQMLQALAQRPKTSAPTPQAPQAPQLPGQARQMPGQMSQMDLNAIMRMMQQRQAALRNQAAMGQGMDQMGKPGPMSSQGMSPPIAPMYSGLLGVDYGTGGAAIPNLGYSGMF